MKYFMTITNKSVQLHRIILICLLVSLANLASDTKPTQAQSSSVPPVEATYHGIKPFQGFAVSGDYDAWTYGDIAFYAPPGRVTQEMANQWLAWYARVDELYRIVVPRTDAEFELVFRGNDPNFGRKKVIAFAEDSCGAGCGNKGQAETVWSTLDAAVADPYDFTHHWILFYEMGRGGGNESFDYRANWPVDQIMLPHLMASFAYYDLGGMDALLSEVDGSGGTPRKIWLDMDNWQADGHKYVEYFTDQNQTWFDPNGYFPITPGIIQRIGVEQGLEAVNRVFDNISDYPASASYESATDAMCDFQEAVNEATNGQYADKMVNDWGLPSCGVRVEPPSPATYAGDIRNEGSSKCIDREVGVYAQLSQETCNGSEAQRLIEVPVDGGFLLQFENSDQCVEDGYGGGAVNQWRCSTVPHMTFNWDGGRLRSNFSGLCMTVSDERVNSGARLRMEACSDSPFQRFNALLGDVNCDRQVNVVDALYIMQREVQLRTDSATCPAADTDGTLLHPVGDVNADMNVNVLDALAIMQCEAQIANAFCPE